MKEKTVQIVADLSNCSRSLRLRDVKKTTKDLRRFVREVGMRIIKSQSHKFGMGGFSWVVIVAESHVAIHTWRAEKIVNVDIFFCSYTKNNQAKARKLLEILTSYFGAKRVETKVVARQP